MQARFGKSRQKRARTAMNLCSGRIQVATFSHTLRPGGFVHNINAVAKPSASCMAELERPDVSPPAKPAVRLA
jgi:hypothetical protein